MKDGAMHLRVVAVRTLEANNAVKLRGEHSETSAHEREVNPNEYKGDALDHSGPSTAVKGIDRLEGPAPADSGWSMCSLVMSARSYASGVRQPSASNGR